MPRLYSPVSLVPYQMAEDEWGAHPECPVEVLDDGTQVWRVPPGTWVNHYGGVVGRVVVRAVPPPSPGYVGVSYTADPADPEIWWAEWRWLRRLDYTPASACEEVPEAPHAPR